MNKQEQDYASDSDESDEDFCPDKTNNSDAPSEEDSDDPISDNDDVPASKKTNSKTKKKDRSKQTQPQTKKSNKEPIVEEEERVVATRNRSETTTKSSIEKNELESDEEDSSRKEALWADFLSDIPTTTPSRTNNPAAVSRKESDKGVPPKTIEKNDTHVPRKEPEKVVIKEIFDFAGEEVLVEKTVSADSIKANGSKKDPAPSETPRGSVKRPGGGGLSSILGQLDKKKKISVLEKSKLDWDSFKTSEGIDEDLQTFNKGKDGYLQRQDFLERTDLRQFEIEKSLRASRRKPL